MKQTSRYLLWHESLGSYPHRLMDNFNVTFIQHSQLLSLLLLNSVGEESFIIDSVTLHHPTEITQFHHESLYLSTRERCTASIASALPAHNFDSLCEEKRNSLSLSRTFHCFQSLPDICQMIVISGLTTDDDVNVSQICFLTKAKIHYFLLLTKPAILYLFPFWT